MGTGPAQPKLCPCPALGHAAFLGRHLLLPSVALASRQIIQSGRSLRETVPAPASARSTPLWSPTLEVFVTQKIQELP